MSQINKSFRSGSGLVVVALALLSPLAVSALDFHTGDEVNIPATQVVNDDLYSVGGMLSSAGVVNGDLYAAGGSVLVTGKVSSDVVISGGNLTITGDVGDDVRAVGGTIVVQGAVGGDVLAAGGQINLSGSTVGGDVALAGGKVRLDAATAGDVRVAGGEVYLNAPIAGNVDVQTDKLTLGPSAVVQGTLTYKASKEVVMEAGAVVKGKVTYTPTPKPSPDTRRAFASAFLFIKLLMMLVGGFFFAFAFRRFTTEVTHIAYEEPFKEMGRGLIFLIVMPIVSVILLATVVGIPLGILGIISFIAAMIFGSLFAPVVFGSFLYRFITKKESEVNWKSVLLGVLVFSFMSLVPILGGLAQFFLILLTLGAAVNMKWRVIKEWR